MRSITADTVLACWCWPNGCHCECIWQVWEEYEVPWQCPHCSAETWATFATRPATCRACKKPFSLH
jgi:hypothetical protein